MARRRKPAEIWEQQENESAEAYEAFSEYRDMKPTERSLAKVGRKLGKSKVLMDRWSSRHEWVYRAREYDRSVEWQALAKATDELAKMRKKHITIGQMLQEKGVSALEKMPLEMLCADPAVLLRFLSEGTRIEEQGRKAEQAAHQPSQKETAEDDALQKLDDILGRIKSEF